MFLARLVSPSCNRSALHLAMALLWCLFSWKKCLFVYLRVSFFVSAAARCRTAREGRRSGTPWWPPAAASCRRGRSSVRKTTKHKHRGFTKLRDSRAVWWWGSARYTLVAIFLIFVGLWAGLHKNYWTQFHNIWLEDESRSRIAPRKLWCESWQTDGSRT